MESSTIKVEFLKLMNNDFVKQIVQRLGGQNRVTANNQWRQVAKKLGFDMFNALELMDNREFLAKLKFISSDVYLHYYVYNWKCPRMEPSQIGLVLQW